MRAAAEPVGALRREWLAGRPEAARLFVRVSDVSLDDAGNARGAAVLRLAPSGSGPRWAGWAEGEAVETPGHRVVLRGSRRAGLHFVCEWMDGRSGEWRYGANVPIRAPGDLVLVPSSAARPGAALADALGDPAQAAHLRAVLRGVHGTSPADLGHREAPAAAWEDADEEGARLFRSPEAHRHFVLVDDVVLDGDGNARDAKVYVLERTGRGGGCRMPGAEGIGRGFEWVRWSPGQALRWLPFRMRLDDTRRAGLHVTAWIRPVPDDGPEWTDYRFVSAFPLRRNGVAVLAPGLAASAGQWLDGMWPPARWMFEEDMLNRALRFQHGWACGPSGRPARWIHDLPRWDDVPAERLGAPRPVEAARRAA